MTALGRLRAADAQPAKRRCALVLDGTVPSITPDGVTMTAGTYRPTDVCDTGIADARQAPHPAHPREQPTRNSGRAARWGMRLKAAARGAPTTR